MKEKPILFSGEMVRAILAGRKTQTRRVIKPQPDAIACAGHCPGKDAEPKLARDYLFVDEEGQQVFVESPYATGQTLWVRETWADIPETSPGNLHFKASATQADLRWFEENQWKWRPSIHMPRWASRITLEVTDVRVERVQDISEGDAIAEGIDSCSIPVAPPLHSEIRYIAPGVKMMNCYGESDDYAPAHASARRAFECLWNSLNAKRGFDWEANPYVWVIEFKRIGEGE